ncbi:MAG: hypothetical protein V7722_05960 [Porticoccus sp.]
MLLLASKGYMMKGTIGFVALVTRPVSQLIGVIFLGLLMVWALSRPSLTPDIQGQSAVPSESATISPNRVAGVAPWELTPPTTYTAYTKLDEIVGLLEEGGELDSWHLQRVKLLLDQVFQFGPEALPTIHDFLLSGTDAPLSATLVDDSSSVRLILIQMLRYMDDPKVVEVAFDTLHFSQDPMEVYFLASIVNDWSEPGWYNKDVLSFVEGVLQQNILEGEVDSVGPLIQILGEQGDETTAGKLAAMPPYLQQSAAVAMAQLPDGSGMPFLVNEARSSGGYTLQGRLALRLLAQSALAQPSAANELVQLAAENKIPPEMWPELMKLIKGVERLQLVVDSGQRADQEIIFHPEGDEVWYRVRAPSQNTQDKQNGELIGRLYAVTTDSSVRRLLETTHRSFK